MDQVLAVGLAAAVFLGLLTTAEVATRRRRIDPEVSRKFVHISSGLVAASLPLVMSFVAIAVLALLFIPFMVVSRRVGLFPAVHGVERATWGEAYFPLGVLLAAAFFPRPTPYAYGVLVMGLSDALASFAGRRFGKREYRLSTATKTYVGSTVFFATTAVLTLGALLAEGRLSITHVLAVPAVAGALTLLEGLSAGGVDNVLLPVAGAGLVSVTY